MNKMQEILRSLKTSINDCVNCGNKTSQNDHGKSFHRIKYTDDTVLLKRQHPSGCDSPRSGAKEPFLVISALFVITFFAWLASDIYTNASSTITQHYFITLTLWEGIAWLILALLMTSINILLWRSSCHKWIEMSQQRK